MKKSIIIAGTVLTFTLGGLGFTGNTVQAEPSTIEEVKSERAGITKNLNAVEKDIANVLFDIKDLQDKMTQLNQALEANKTAVLKVDKSVADKEKEIKKQEEIIKKIEIDLEESKEVFSNRLTSYQQAGGDVQFIEVLAGSKGMTEFISRLSAVETISKADQKIMNDYLAKITLLEVEEAKLNKQVEVLKEEKEELREVKMITESQKEEVKKSSAELEQKQKTLVEKKSKLQSKNSTLDDIEASLTAPAAIEEVSPVVSNGNGEAGSVAASSSSVANTNNRSNSTASAATPATPAAKKTTKKATSGQVYKPTKGGSAISAGASQLSSKTGKGYVFGGKNPSSGFDCSGFVSWAYAQEGISLPSYTGALATKGRAVSKSELQPGDLVFFNTTGTPNSHVGIYVGGGQFIGSQSSSGVSYASVNDPYYWGSKFDGARRIK